MDRGIERRARQLCYAENSSACENHCGPECRAVCPSDHHLILASRQLFEEYWDAYDAAPARGQRRIRPPVTLGAVWRTTLDSLSSWWRDRRAPPVYGSYVREE